jgi:tRNA (cytidine56-2'-O)-methyltransferase
MEVNVLRLGHRRKRDARITTHVCLTARAFGASNIILSGDEDKKLIENVQDVGERWGGEFQVQYQKNWENVLGESKNSDTEIIHLTMYGEPVQNVIEDLRKSPKNKLVVVGGSRVPTKVYRQADWNVSVTTQPHSEVSALALFLHLFFQGEELYKEFKGGKLKVLPSAQGKRLWSREDLE